jgi:hypothetical protein
MEFLGPQPRTSSHASSTMSYTAKNRTQRQSSITEQQRAEMRLRKHAAQLGFQLTPISTAGSTGRCNTVIRGSAGPGYWSWKWPRLSWALSVSINTLWVPSTR